MIVGGEEVEMRWRCSCVIVFVLEEVHREPMHCISLYVFPLWSYLELPVTYFLKRDPQGVKV